jgi:hypothetical protein
MNLSLLAIVSLPFAVGASYYFGGPLVGSILTGVTLLSCLVIYPALFRARI